MLRHVVPVSLALALLQTVGCRTTSDSVVKSEPTSGTYGEDNVVCRVGSTRLAYKLSFDWSQDKVDIASNTGPTDGYLPLFKKSTAVRNNAQDGSFLAEGVASEAVVEWDNSCGGVVTSLYFDVTDADGALSGTVTETPRWVKNPNSPADLICAHPLFLMAPRTNAVTCTRDDAPPPVVGGSCPSGQYLVDLPPDQNGCARAAKCVDWSTCPQLSQPPPGWCSDGFVIGGRVDDRGCMRAPICSHPDMCPQFSPPPPNWCADGKIVPGGVDDRGCQRTPRCVTAATCPQEEGGASCAMEIALVCDSGLVDGCLNGATKTHRCVEQKNCEKFIMAETMIHKVNKDCQLAGDGCDVRSLEAQGYTRLAPGQTCSNLDDRMCAKVVTPMIHSQTKKCVAAGDSCQASDLEGQGFRRRAPNEQCSSEPRKNCGLLFVSERMYNKQTKECAAAATTCAVEDLKKAGYRLAKGSECNSGGHPGGVSCAAEIALACEMPFVDGCTLEAPFRTKEHKCVQVPAQICALFIRAEPMFNPSTHECALAGDGCAVSDLSKKGYRSAKSGECATF